MIVVAALLAVIPFLYMLTTSFKTLRQRHQQRALAVAAVRERGAADRELRRGDHDGRLRPQWHVPLFFRYLANSVIVTGSIVLGTLITSMLAAYALARMELPGKKLLFVLVLVTMMVPED